MSPEIFRFFSLAWNSASLSRTRRRHLKIYKSAVGKYVHDSLHTTTVYARPDNFTTALFHVILSFSDENMLNRKHDSCKMYRCFTSEDYKPNTLRCFIFVRLTRVV